LPTSPLTPSSRSDVPEVEPHAETSPLGLVCSITYCTA
jgi:hypothetical protein